MLCPGVSMGTESVMDMDGTQFTPEFAAVPQPGHRMEEDVGIQAAAEGHMANGGLFGQPAKQVLGLKGHDRFRITGSCRDSSGACNVAPGARQCPCS